MPAGALGTDACGGESSRNRATVAPRIRWKWHPLPPPRLRLLDETTHRWWVSLFLPVSILPLVAEVGCALSRSLQRGQVLEATLQAHLVSQTATWVLKATHAPRCLWLEWLRWPTGLR